MDYRENYKLWLEEKSLDPKLRAELEAIADDPREQEERFYTELEFGTAGLRGIIGAGTNRMNIYVVRRATQGLADYLKTFPGGPERGVDIAYDSRHMSDVFAKETALVLAQNGIKAYLYSTLHSVPQLSFTVLHLNCMAGVVITASHNPPEYNGYKVYWQHGGQAGPEQAAEILGYIRKADYFKVKPMEEGAALESGLLNMIGEEVDEAYYTDTMSLCLNPELTEWNGADTRIVYTPLHGSGNVPVREILRRIGIKNISVVKEQEEPDGSFPTVKAPNPEDPNAFTLAFDLANKTGANLILATDPDSDRVGIAVRDGADYRLVTGNETGVLLLDLSGRLFPGRDGIRFSFPHQWEKEGCKAHDGIRYLAGFPFFLLGLPVLDGFRNGGIPVFHMEVIGCLAVIVAERGIGAVIHEANGYFRRVAGHQRSQAIHVRLVGIRSRVDEKFNERNEAFRRFFLGADQVEG